MTEKKKPLQRQSKIRKEIQEIHEQNELAALKSNQSRARSISIGSANGGMVEIILRGELNSMWYILHPVEAVELLEQLASSCGIEIIKRPKQDFSSWRSWELDQPNSSYWKGAAPWQLSDTDKKQLTKAHEQKYGILPMNINSVERPKLEATTRRKKKIQESDNE